MSERQRVSVELTVEDVDTFPSAEDCARDLTAMLDPTRFEVTEVVVVDFNRIRWDDKWRPALDGRESREAGA